MSPLHRFNRKNSRAIKSIVLIYRLTHFQCRNGKQHRNELEAVEMNR